MTKYKNNNSEWNTARSLKESGNIINTADFLYMNQTALGQQITVESTTQFSYKSVYPLSAQRDSITGTVTQVNGAEYKIGANSQLTTKQLGDYIPEYVFLPSIGVRIPSQPTGTDKITFGYFDDNDGTYLEYNSTGLFHKVKSGGVEKYSKQVSGVSVQRGNIFRFPFLFYGYGYAGVDVPKVTNDSMQVNRVSTYYPDGEVLVENSNLPLNCKVEGDTEAFVAGRQMSVVGQNVKIFRAVNAVRKQASIANATDYIPLVSVRLKRKQIFSQLSKITIISNANVEVAIILNGTLTGATFGVPDGYSADEVATDWDNSATAITGGDKIYGAIAEGDNRGELTSAGLPELPLVNGDTVSFCARLISGTNGTTTLNAEVRENW